MDDYTFLKKIYRHLDLNKLVKESPGLSINDIDLFFRKIRDSLGIKPENSEEKENLREFILYTDGAARGNPGPAAVGCVLMNSKGDVLQELGKVIGTATNNVAEYQALIYGLDLAINFQPDRLDIYSDSELLV
ncbi:MAG: ribonuclease HI family protein, partial [bacterium]|nr:ribonuclease HI family protein [bacterium]